MRKPATAPAQAAARHNTHPNYTTSADAARKFGDAVYSDIGASIWPIPDGELHRFNDPKGKHNNQAGWYVLFLDGCPAGKYGNWRTGQKFTWRENSRQQLEPEEEARIEAAIQAARARRERDRVQAQTEAAESAQAQWCDALPAVVSHPYLQAKRIPALSLRQSGGLLLVPMLDIDSNLVNLQTINSTGKKRFLKGGRITGCFSLTGAPEIPKAREVYIAEGFATAATIATELHLPVVAAMNAGNLKPVAIALRQRYPGIAIVVAADNDHKTPGNPGISKGGEAAKAVQGALTWPSVCMAHDCTCTDYNDTAHCRRAAR